MGRKIEFIKEKEIITIDLDDFKKIARLTSNLKLKEDIRVTSYENTNFKDVDHSFFDKKIDFIIK